MNTHIREMVIDDYGEAYDLWLKTEGMRLEAADSREGIEKYLKKNPGMSYVAVCGGNIVGTILSGEDGRRGYMQHLCVVKEYRRRGIGHELIESSLLKFKKAGIREVRIFIYKSNEVGNRYWDKKGWITRDDIYVKTYEM